jgi:hypothetical protein
MRTSSLMTALLVCGSCAPGQTGADAGRDGGGDAGLADAGRDAGLPLDAGRDAGVDAGPVICWDAGALDSGFVWTGFGGSCNTLVAPLAWCSSGMDLCPLPDGGTVFTYLLADPQNCGACGLTCAPPFGSCGNGRCLPCDNCSAAYVCPGQLPDGSIVLEGSDLTDDSNCGECNCPCQAGQHCLELGPGLGFTGPNTPWGASVPFAECFVSCANGEYPCPLPDGGRGCTNIQTDNLNCGACGAQCCPGESCNGVTCRIYPNCGDAG